MTLRLMLIAAALTVAQLAPAAAPAVDAEVEDELTVLPDDLFTVTEGYPQRKVTVRPREMMHAWLMSRVRPALNRYDQRHDALLKEPQRIQEHKETLRAQFLEQIGGLPERSPLNARVVGRLDRDGYRVEKVIFESQPGHHVTALLFLPMTPPPYPGVIVPCGHTSNGKAGASYQRMSILLARSGMAALCYDPLDQGERHQFLQNGSATQGRGAWGHSLIAVNSMLVGRSAARLWVWDAMRAIDYLQSRPDINPEAIGCVGNSGGGTATTYVMALDHRIRAAVPSCFITSLRRLMEKNVAADGEQHLFNAITLGISHPEFIVMRSPLPTLISAARHDYFFDIDGAWDTFRRAKEIYGLEGFAERVDLVEAVGSHGLSPTLRVGAARWLRRWLLNIDDAVTERPDEPVLSDEEAQVTPDGEVLLLPGARSSYMLNMEYEAELAQARRRFWGAGDRGAALNEVRRITGIRPLDEIPEVSAIGAGRIQRDGYVIDKRTIRIEPNLWLPALVFVPPRRSGEAYLYLNDAGKHADAGPGGPIEQLVRQGHVVMAVDLRGMGETEAEEPPVMVETTRLLGNGWQDMFLAYELGTSYLAMRTEDVLACARVLATFERRNPSYRVHLVGIGRVGPPALHAAALEPQLFESVTLIRCLDSWSSVVHTPIAPTQLENAVHGALTVYDLPDLRATLPDAKLRVIDPVDATGRIVSADVGATP